MASSRNNAALLLAIAGAAAIGLGFVSDRVRKGKTFRMDRRIRRVTTGERRNRVARAAAVASGPLGKWYGHLPLALATARRLQNDGRPAGGAAVAGASVAAIGLSRALDRLMEHRPPPPGRQEPWEQSYPSGHALETTAVALTSGYVLVREGIAEPWVAAPLALAAIASGLGRLALDRHWATDLLGGYCAGIALGATCAGLYELAIASDTISTVSTY